MHDIIIAGGGPAGLTAAVYGLRGGRSVLVIEKSSFGGQIAFSPKVENIPGTIQISGGNSALQEALLLSKVCRKVTIVQNLADFTGEKKLADALAEKDNVEVFFSTLVDEYLTEDGTLKGLRLRNDVTGEKFEIAVDGAFLAVGLQPENDDFAAFAKLNDWGYFDSVEDCLTETEGLFVAGDCRSTRIRQVTTAADGAIAAMAACHYLDSVK